jgi:hypothetical protein
MKIKVIRIIITRDPMTKIPKEVFPWEVPIYRSQYGDEKVAIVGEAKDVEREQLADPQEEYFRLRQQFGIDPDTKQSHADIVYGRGQDGIDKLEKAMNASKRSGDVEAAQKVVDGKGKLDPETAEKREGAYRDVVGDEFTEQSNNSVIGAASGEPGTTDTAAGAVGGKAAAANKK